MSKKRIVAVIGVVAIVVITAGAFVMQERQKVTKQNQVGRQMDNKQQTQDNAANEDEQKPIVDKDLSDQEKINRLKNDESLVWYSVPELGIKFKVTKDSGEDLKYSIEKDVKFGAVTAYFYSQSFKNFIDTDSKIKRTAMSDYSKVALSKISIKENTRSEKVYGKAWCFKDWVMFTNNGNVYCSDPPQSYNFDSWQQEQTYDETVKDKNFGVYFNTIEALNK